jgi:hypothetical protein
MAELPFNVKIPSPVFTSTGAGIIDTAGGCAIEEKTARQHKKQRTIFMYNHLSAENSK